MFRNSSFHAQQQGTAEEKLKHAVIAKTLEEWICGPLRSSRNAEQFLFEDKRDFLEVCSSAGMDPKRLRKRLQMIRTRGIPKELVPLRLRIQKKMNFPQPGNCRQKAFGV